MCDLKLIENHHDFSSSVLIGIQPRGIYFANRIKKMLQEILSDEINRKCIRIKTGQCEGRITLEHAIIFAGKQVNEKWAILPVCEYHHAVGIYQDGGDLDKRYHEYVALSRLMSLSSEEIVAEKIKYERAWDQWLRKLELLNRQYTI